MRCGDAAVVRRVIELLRKSGEEPQKERTPSLDQAGLLLRAFALDVFTCVRCVELASHAHLHLGSGQERERASGRLPGFAQGRGPGELVAETVAAGPRREARGRYAGRVRTRKSVGFTPV